MIPIRNVYYMLSYAFQILQEQGYNNISTEDFDNTAELCSAILSKGISLQLKRGLNKDYIEANEPLSAIKGKIDISDSIKTRSIMKSQLVCSYDEFSENSYFNKILKTTVMLLLKADISKSRKKELKNLMMFFSNVDTLDVHDIDWHIRYNKNNQSYHLLLSICNLVIEGLLQTQQDGTSKLMNFIDEQRMCRLYEKFILEYYRKHYPSISANAEQIPWQLDDGMSDMLPVMQSDIMLREGNQVLIIDAKYYTHTTQSQYDTHTLHSANLYQVFTYVKNKEHELKDKEHKVSGMLLYARTDEEIQPNNTYSMSGNRIDVRTLDLNCDFSFIKQQLDSIVKEFF
ncbi:MAG: 5-methylcytosine-specific restriction endonuclease system specificity protein McrC [Eubacteriales bacterium]|nr:5-methylcytosine-specific restriction endonuclease system specificity protein McrC [Christensenellaceae bacterium]MDY2751608.1 5-methylcytosine-specific restriction endonuclease system specificity protein McrC [Eubacteriales bacterium]